VSSVEPIGLTRPSLHDPSTHDDRAPLQRRALQPIGTFGSRSFGTRVVQGPPSCWSALRCTVSTTTRVKFAISASVLFLVAASFATHAIGQPSKWLDRDASFVLDEARAGEIQLGMSVDQVAALVGQEWLTLRATFPEGTFQPVLDIASPWVENGPALSARISASSNCTGFFVGPIWVFDRRFKTAEGVGPGSTLGDLRRAYGSDALRLSVGGEEGSPPSARLDRLGLNFFLNGAGGFDDSLVVVSVLVLRKPTTNARSCA
jgi:hypothetical protein